MTALWLRDQQAQQALGPYADQLGNFYYQAPYIAAAFGRAAERFVWFPRFDWTPKAPGHMEGIYCRTTTPQETKT